MQDTKVLNDIFEFNGALGPFSSRINMCYLLGEISNEVYRELEILKELYDLPGIKNALNTAINKLRKLNQEIEQPIYYKRAKKHKGKVILVEKEGKDEY